MRKSMFLLAFLALFSGSVLADQDNMDRAIADAVKVNKKGGEEALTNRARFCYDNITLPRGGSTSQIAADKAEACFAFEFASFLILRKANLYSEASYFNAENIIVRATYNLERARVLTLPEQVSPYLQSRFAYINTRLDDPS